MSKFRFTPEMFLDGTTLSAEECKFASNMANAALDEHLKSLETVFGVFSPDEYLFFSSDKKSTDTHTALLWGLEELKPKECLHSSLRTRHDGKLNCSDCGKVLEYRLVEV